MTSKGHSKSLADCVVQWRTYNVGIAPFPTCSDLLAENHALFLPYCTRGHHRGDSVRISQQWL